MKKIDLRSKAIKALLAILFFLISYLLLMLGSFCLVVACALGGIFLVSLKPTLITLMLGIGLVGLGCIVLFFLFKFIFKKSKTDLSGMVEITEQDEPQLFALIRALASEVKTSFPKRIYITSDVNASVFYDSSILSMFLPTRKNLQIGLGLVNATTESELKAILAHEFGHFSQKSMSIGSYVYNVNRVIYNLINDNESFDALIQKWANISGYFAFFAGISVKIIRGIQWILMKLYAVVNISYMELSREMEFEADEIAASITGPLPLQTALLRLDFADTTFNSVMSFYGNRIAENQKTTNLYPNHLFAMEKLAVTYKLPSDQGLPSISLDMLDRFNKSQLVIKDQWASHPSTRERVERLQSLSFENELGTGTAWKHFSNREKIQGRLTSKLFESVSFEQTPQEMDHETFITLYSEQENKYAFDPIYSGFYDRKNIGPFDVESTLSATDLAGNSLQELFCEEHLELVYRRDGIRTDLFQLEQIATENLKVSSFDFAGKRYKAKEATFLHSSLKPSLEEAEEKIVEIDKKAFVYFMQRAALKNKHTELKSLYTSYFLCDAQLQKDNELYEQIANATHFLSEVTPFEQIPSKISILNSHEAQLKARLSSLIADKDVVDELNKDIKEKVDLYLSREWRYFSESQYNEVALDHLFASIAAFNQLSNLALHFEKKRILDFQAQLQN